MLFFNWGWRKECSALQLEHSWPSGLLTAVAWRVQASFLWILSDWHPELSRPPFKQPWGCWLNHWPSLHPRFCQWLRTFLSECLSTRANCPAQMNRWAKNCLLSRHCQAASSQHSRQLRKDPLSSAGGCFSWLSMLKAPFQSFISLLFLSELCSDSLLLMRSASCQSRGAEVSNDSTLSPARCASDIPAKYMQLNSPFSFSISLIHTWVQPK